MVRLRRSDLSKPGIVRRRSGKGFSYRHPDGTLLDKEDRQRINALAIPPAWTDVWISPYENAHIQATGVDAAGRSQYIYHPRWRERKDNEKFQRAAELGSAFPSIRRAVTLHLKDTSDPRQQTLAAAVRLMDLGALRIGSESYMKQNGSYGLTTLRCRHARVKENAVGLKFPGKSGQWWDTSINDPALAAFLEPLSRRPGKERLLAYKANGSWIPLDGSMVNEYLRSIAGEAYSSKDFRTWKGTAAAALCLLKTEGTMTRPQALVRAMKEAAELLGNTPTVARTSYVDPRIVEAYLSGELMDVKPTEPSIAEFLIAKQT
ncbi:MULTISPECIES: DNA topoisomerase IB [Paenarthrobacter]|uniref:DNA topoisomerase n=1 Tax=Paenarthrobacter ureafaciens TaxID=37931 RepID=A0AAX3EJU6_PAEUR|nr:MULTISPECIES: DNA topoisomerase IB [Paenarthrobacter]NKR12620.1 DNA topoisomerase [Arthrobacter sp. M5]NKR15936.1 DNA topoisomerase [Arthrobacter sp. M6]OEH59912.1 DNA topoisomerase [Arthrobacter sp. D4]OEH59942.1 DNA topoisomerase [Arthrobacter sp. D2]MDO5862892.1 DNA topoisomerase IB [Paenarthrobacter sp. SD-2]